MKNTPILTFNCEEKEIEKALIWDCKHFLGLKFIKNQVRTPVGIIDVLAVNPQNKRVFYVIEIKRDTLNSCAYTQCMRYVHYLNRNHNKGGKRLFLPLLIGKNLSQELHGISKHFDADENHDYNDIGYCLYTLFEFNVKDGLSFKYRNMAQETYHDTYLSNYQGTYFDKLSEVWEDKNYEYYLQVKDLKYQISNLKQKLYGGDQNA